MKKDKQVIAYTPGVFDLFHVGHLNILRNAKALCDILIVGVTTDETCKKVKGRKPIIPFHERIKIVEAIKYVDVVIPQENMNKFEAWKKIKFNIILVGDDWQNSKKWKKWEKQFAKENVKVVYLPYTKEESSTKIRKNLPLDFYEE